jgi:hypothetical protein
MWGLWWTKGHWGRFSPSTSVSLADHHSTNFFIIIITIGLLVAALPRGPNWTPPSLYQLKNTSSGGGGFLSAGKSVLSYSVTARTLPPLTTVTCSDALSRVTLETFENRRIKILEDRLSVCMPTYAPKKGRRVFLLLACLLTYLPS